MGSGWLGLPLAEKLLQASFSVNVSTTSEEKLNQLKSKGLNAYKIDIDNLQDSAFFQCEILIINITSKNISGFEKLLSLIKQNSIQKIIFTSSTSVYPMINDWVNESTPTQNTPLAEIENLFFSLAAKQTTILRLAGLYGYNRQPGRFFKNKKIIPNPKGFINLVHRDDVIAVIEKIIEKNVWGEIFNVCSDEHPQRQEFYTQQIQSMGRPAPEFGSAKNNLWKKIANCKVKEQIGVSFRTLGN